MTANERFRDEQGGRVPEDLRQRIARVLSDRAQIEPGGAAITDRLTTLYTRPMFEAVLAKELERAGRFGTPVALMLFDIDRLSQINQEHGYGVGDRIIERVGITLGKYFRQH